MFFQITSDMQNAFERQQSISENLAGSKLPGYRAEHTVEQSFQNQMYQKMNTDKPNMEVYGADKSEVVYDFSQAELRDTGRSLDFALSGDGFFTVQNPESDQLLLTRNGDFKVSPEGTLMTRDGYSVQTRGGGEVTIQNADRLNTLNADQNGNLTIQNGDQGTRELGQLDIRTTEDKSIYDRFTSNYFHVPSEDDQEKLEFAEGCHVVNGKLESANISPIQEMSSMIMNSRRFELAQSALKMKSDLSSKESRVLG